ncbi:glucosyltransferase domain-containing protein [Butyrivibrio sp. AE2015]|uniref:glucosyltransferase domain-containing protein n=1 Tax=Butyrivibrio sp. AE2015 TaxID=1280663 RepID=UPI0003B6CF5F|nr:glucosyltransferase domain-containing protein [Butyrivibrio sp. AE2015]
MIENLTKKYWKLAAFLFVFAAALYSVFMSEQLTNNLDGYWQQEYYVGNNWEFTCGRWFIVVLDKLLLGVHIDPLVSLVSIVLFVLGFVLALDLFDIKSGLPAFLCGAIFLSSAPVLSILGYKFCSSHYALSFFLSVLAMYLVGKVNAKLWPIIAGGVLLCLSLGIYQAFLGTAAVVAFFYIISEIFSGKSFGDSFKKALRLLGTIILGGVLYTIVTNIVLKVTDLGLTDFHGASEVGVGSIFLSLLEVVGGMYSFIWEASYINILDNNGIDLLIKLFVAVVVIYLFVNIFKKDRKNAVLFAVLVALLPVAADAVLIISRETEPQIHMSLAVYMILPFLILIAMKEIDVAKLVRGLVIAFVVLIIYGNSMQVIVDQYAMLEGKKTMLTFANMVVSDLEDMGALSPDIEYFIIGKPYSNGLYYKNELQDRALGYANVGDFILDEIGMHAYYDGLFRKTLGLNMNISRDYYEDKAYSEYLADMPSFPNEGYIVKWDNYVIIKMSEP